MEESGRFERHGVNRAVVSSDAQHPGWFTLPGAPGGDRTLTPCGTGSWDRRVSRNSTTSACVPRAAAMLPIVDSNHNRRIQGAVSCRLDEWAWGFALPAGWQTRRRDACSRYGHFKNQARDKGSPGRQDLNPHMTRFRRSPLCLLSYAPLDTSAEMKTARQGYPCERLPVSTDKVLHGNLPEVQLRKAQGSFQ
jgi:hypothetical protein